MTVVPWTTPAPPAPARSWRLTEQTTKSWGGEAPIWTQDAQRWVIFGGSGWQSGQEKIDHDFVSYFLSIIASDPIVFGVTERRRQVFSQANVMWQLLESGRGTTLTSSAELDLLRTPWPNASLAALFARMECDDTAAGNSYWTLANDEGKIGRAARGSRTTRFVRLRPDWVTIIVGVPNEPDADVNDPRGRVIRYEFRTPRMTEPLILLPEEVVHYAPRPDTLARFRGMSWLRPVLLEVQADQAATTHKINFFRNGAVHAMALKYPPNTPPELLQEYKKLYDAEYGGVENHYKTFHIAGADPVPMSADFQALDLKRVQGGLETRIAMCSGVPAAIAQISDGLEGSTLNTGNFTATKRLFVDTTIRDLWGHAMPALQTLVTPPQQNQRLWYDDRDIPFLREDAKDAAATRAEDAKTINTLIMAGYDADAVVQHVRTGDLSTLIGKHNGLPSVQQQEQPAPNRSTNGSRRNEIEAVARP